MKYYLIFECKDMVSLPVQHNHILQAAILKWLQDPEYTEFLHNKGYQQEKRIFKLYSFSELIGERKYDKKAQKLIFSKKVGLFISSYMDDMEKYVKEGIEEARPLQFGKSFLTLVEAYRVEEETTPCIVETVSPVSIHSTYELSSGRKKTYYYSPTEKEFSDMMKDNLIRKYIAVHGKEPEDTRFIITAVNKQAIQKQIIKYRETIIIGWKGRFSLEGSEEMIKMALQAGIGARNSIGLGCLLQEKDGQSKIQ